MPDGEPTSVDRFLAARQGTLGEDVDALRERLRVRRRLPLRPAAAAR